MIVLDTNVLSAVMRNQPSAEIVDWLDRQPVESVWTTAITVYEIRFGIEILSVGRKRRRLENEFVRLLDEDLERRILPFDRAAAELSGKIAAEQRKRGRPVEIRDVQIAGIVALRKASLATHNLRHFEGLGLTLLDPWAG